jgi:hypothetical protein
MGILRPPKITIAESAPSRADSLPEAVPVPKPSILLPPQIAELIMTSRELVIASKQLRAESERRIDGSHLILGRY